MTSWVGRIRSAAASVATLDVRRRRPSFVLAMLWPVFGIARPAEAQTTGPRIAPPVLGTPGSTRALALGDAYTALGSDPDVIFYNPAQLLPARGISIGMQRYEHGSTVLNVSAASVLAPGTIAVGIQFLDQESDAASYHILARRGEAALFERGLSLATGAVGSLAYARPAFFNTRVGITGKVIHQEFGEERDITGAFDVGISRGSAFQLALVARNLGHGVSIFGATSPLPREVALGGAMPRREIGPLDLAATASAGLLADGTWRGGGGTEWSYMPLDGFTFVARIGYRAVEAAEAHVTTGAGFVGERVSLDWALQVSDGTGTVHRFGVRWR